MPELRAGETVTIVRRSLAVDGSGNPAPDGYGNDVYVNKSLTVKGCAISPGYSSESVQGTDQVISDIVVHMPHDTVVLSSDGIITPDGLSYEVIGDPKSWQSPFTGTFSAVEVPCKRVRSGGPAT